MFKRVLVVAVIAAVVCGLAGGLAAASNGRVELTLHNKTSHVLLLTNSTVAPKRPGTPVFANSFESTPNDPRRFGRGDLPPRLYPGETVVVAIKGSEGHPFTFQFEYVPTAESTSPTRPESKTETSASPDRHEGPGQGAKISGVVHTVLGLATVRVDDQGPGVVRTKLHIITNNAARTKATVAFKPSKAACNQCSEKPASSSTEGAKDENDGGPRLLLVNNTPHPLHLGSQGLKGAGALINELPRELAPKSTSSIVLPVDLEKLDFEYGLSVPLKIAPAEQVYGEAKSVASMSFSTEGTPSLRVIDGDPEELRAKVHVCQDGPAKGTARLTFKEPKQGCHTCLLKRGGDILGSIEEKRASTIAHRNSQDPSFFAQLQAEVKHYWDVFRPDLERNLKQPRRLDPAPTVSAPSQPPQPKAAAEKVVEPCVTYPSAKPGYCDAGTQTD